MYVAQHDTLVIALICDLQPRCQMNLFVLHCLMSLYSNLSQSFFKMYVSNNLVRINQSTICLKPFHDK